MARYAFAPWVFKSRVFKPAALAGVGPAASTARPGLIWKTSRRNVNIKSGYARAHDSLHPSLWKGLKTAVAPHMGNTGSTVINFARPGQPGTVVSLESRSPTSWSFNETDNEISMPTPLDGLSAFSVSAWFWGDSDGATNVSTLCNWVGGANRQILMRGLAGMFQFYTFTGSPLGGNVATYTSDAWHHIVCTYHASQGGMESWMDGVLSATTYAQTGTINTSATGNVRIGGGSGAASEPYHDGQIGPVYVWDDKISPDEIFTLKADPLAPFRLRMDVPVQFPTTVVGMVCLKADQVYSPGAIEDHVYMPGALADQVYRPGLLNQQIGC